MTSNPRQQELVEHPQLRSVLFSFLSVDDLCHQLMPTNNRTCASVEQHVLEQSVEFVTYMMAESQYVEPVIQRNSKGRRIELVSTANSNKVASVPFARGRQYLQCLERLNQHLYHSDFVLQCLTRLGPFLSDGEDGVVSSNPTVENLMDVQLLDEKGHLDEVIPRAASGCEDEWLPEEACPNRVRFVALQMRAPPMKGKGPTFLFHFRHLLVSCSSDRETEEERAARKEWERNERVSETMEERRHRKQRERKDGRRKETEEERAHRKVKEKETEEERAARKERERLPNRETEEERSRRKERERYRRQERERAERERSDFPLPVQHAIVFFARSFIKLPEHLVTQKFVPRSLTLMSLNNSNNGSSSFVCPFDTLKINSQQGSRLALLDLSGLPSLSGIDWESERIATATLETLVLPHQGARMKDLGPQLFSSLVSKTLDLTTFVSLPELSYSFLMRHHVLVHVDLGAPNLTKICDKVLNGCVFLQHVSLTSASSLHTIGSDFCSECPLLHSIDLPSQSGGNAWRLKNIGSLFANNCPSLTHLDLSRVPNLSSLPLGVAQLSGTGSNRPCRGKWGPDQHMKGPPSRLRLLDLRPLDREDSILLWAQFSAVQQRARVWFQQMTEQGTTVQMTDRQLDAMAAADFDVGIDAREVQLDSSGFESW